MVDIVARELRVRHDMLVVATAWSRLGHPDGTPGPEEALYGIHGGDIETSIMLHLRPDLVRMDKAEDFRSTQLDFIDEFKHLRAHGPVQFGWKAQDLNPYGAVGNADGGDRGEGQGGRRPSRRAPSSSSAATLHAFRYGAAVEALAGTRARGAPRASSPASLSPTTPATLKLKSRDFYWFSPILKPLLDDKRADLVGDAAHEGRGHPRRRAPAPAIASR